MREKDVSDVGLSLMAAIFDALAVFGGFMLAAWLRFGSNWVPGWHAPPQDVYKLYALSAAAAVVVFLLVIRAQGLYVRPQTGSFVNRIPRLIKSSVLGTLASAVLAFAVQNEIDLSRLVMGMSVVTILCLLLLERWVLFRVEWNLARHSRRRNHVLILGTDSVAARLKRTLGTEPMLRAQVIGFLRTDLGAPATGIGAGEVLGTIDELDAVLERERVDQLILASAGLPSDRVLAIMLLCERNLITFNMVPDLFRLMTTSMDVQSLDDIPLLGISPWPLDKVWPRALKRVEDIVGSLMGLLIAAPVIAAAAVAIKITSPGPVFYRQERCGRKGRTFMLHKLRTMRPNAEAETGPVFASEHDTRRTRVGAFLRRHNLDELPQLWNVLRGDMSLVGPRPERPHFVEQFKAEVARYMWRHVSKPGLTGWAQVNGLRGDTSITERVKYDLYYLENWSPAFDFKILLKTVFANQNAY